MSRHSYISLPGQHPREEWLQWRFWFPRVDQIIAALRFQMHDALDPFERGETTATMREGLGLVIVTALVAGVIPLVANLFLAVPMATSVPMAQLGSAAAQITDAYRGIIPIEVAGTTVQTLAGLEPRMPGFLAAFLSAVGIWLNWPLGWLANWIVYGALVAGMARLFRATSTLGCFLAGTSFAFVPLVLVGLGPIPWIGPLFVIVGFAWSVAVYYKTVHYVTELDAGRRSSRCCSRLPS
ncbi:MAG: hypothetical protein IPK16_02245 [Anaerolineales bacterium]|nr:hypothetical protein [Anaerolineales bacterium]